MHLKTNYEVINDDANLEYNIFIMISIAATLKMFHLVVIYRVFYSRAQPRAPKDMPTRASP